ncbi:MAG: hypothetical protein LUD79_04750 [Oscillospiraceae bacterium]|nr:hypothetical protein [Oscillospiraceae bacterium]
MASGVEELLGMLYDMIEDGKSVPMHAEQCRIDRDRALDLLDEIRAQFPVELGEAQKLVATKEEYIASAKREADSVRTQAQEQVKRLLNENEIVQQAKDVANDIVKKAQETSKSLKQAANGYCEDILRQTDAAVSQASAQLRQAQAQFRKLSGSSDSGSGDGRAEIYDAENDDL